jgi:DNA-binding XRE family transcriptional regulator
MNSVNQILSEYSLTRETAAQYIDAITRLNQTQTAEEIGVSRDTINRYKRAFQQMNPRERSQLIASLTQDKLLQETNREDPE